MGKVRIIEVRTYEYDHKDFDEDYYQEHDANTDQQKMELDKKDIETKKIGPEDFDDDPHVLRTFSLVIE